VSFSADLIVTGGPLFSRGRVLVGSAVAVRGDRIVALGPETEVMALAGPRTRLVYLGGRMALPGFVDAHLHLVDYGMTLRQVDCRFPKVRSIGDIQERVRERARVTPPGRWVRAWGYDQSKLEEGRHPTRHDLDEACPDLPVVLWRTCGHIAVVNSTVFRMADITSLTPDPPGGRFDRDPGGEPNGVLRETALAVLEALGGPGEEELVEAVRLGSRELARRGITSVHEAGVSAPALRALQEARRAGDLVTRVYLMLTPSDEAYQEAFMRTGLETGFGDDWLKVGPLKLMLDGSSSGPTAATRDPYSSDPRDRGILRLPPTEVKRRFEAAAEAGFQVTAHAVGDLAVETAVEALEALAEVVGDGGPAGGRYRWRHRIEHCAMTDAALRERIKGLGAVPVLQPVFLWEFGDGYVLNYGRERASAMFPAGSFGRAGVRFALSTDCPVTSPDPMLNVFVAVTRRTMSGDTLGPEERLTLAEALEAYTFGGAWAAHEEDLKGSLEPGRLADITVLSGDPFRVSIEGTRELRAVMTIVGGRVVHEE